MKEGMDLTAIDMEKILQRLEKIAGLCANDTEAQKAIEIAAYAIHFAYAEAVFGQFKQYLKAVASPLTSDQLESLCRMGIDVENLESRTAENQELDCGADEFG